MLYGLKSIDNNDRYLKSDYDVIMSMSDFLKWQDIYKDLIVSLYPSSPNKYRAMVLKDGIKNFYEIELGTEGSSSKYLLDNLKEVCVGELTGFFGEVYSVLDLKFLLLTKKSHLVYPVHFEKNINDYEILKNYLGSFDQNDIMKVYFDMRSSEAKIRYKQRTPKLNVSTEDFFSSKLNVPHYYVHDDIHNVMAHHDLPIFTMMQSDSSSAWCEKDLFFELPYEYQIQCVQEEAYVIALERYIIPEYGENFHDHFSCYKDAVKRICTTLTSGWFREFALENYGEVIRNYNPNFVTIFDEAVKSGSIKGINK